MSFKSEGKKEWKSADVGKIFNIESITFFSIRIFMCHKRKSCGDGSVKKGNSNFLQRWKEILKYVSEKKRSRYCRKV